MRGCEHALMRQSISLRVCVCMREHVHEAAHKLARLFILHVVRQALVT